MASLTFEGEIQELSNEQIQCITDVLEKHGFKDNKVLIAPAGQVGDNYAANVKRITVEVENGDNFSLIAKVAPTIEVVRQAIMAEMFFLNEIMMYSEVLPKLAALQVAANVPKEDRLKYPECYGFLTEEPHELILLEDLKPLNYSMLDRMKSLPNEAVKLILKNFALLHSLCYVVKKREPDTFNAWREKIVDLSVKVYDRPENEIFAKATEVEILSILDNENHKKIMKGMLSTATKMNKRNTIRDNGSKSSVIIQGDGWTNNVMFDIEGETIKDCIMIDYQVSREGSPVCDILYMIFNCTDHKTRVDHYHEWLDYYHEQLDKSLNNFDMKANDVYPRDVLDADMRRYCKVFVGTAIIILNITLRKGDEAAEMKNAMGKDFETMTNSMAASNLSPETLALYKTRIEELIESCLTFGLL